MLDVTDDLQIVDSAARLSITEISREVEALERHLGTLKESLDINRSQAGEGALAGLSESYVRTLSAKVVEFDAIVKDLQKMRRLMLRKAGEVFDYFGETTDAATAPDTAKLFAVLQQFRRAVLEGKMALERKERSAARNGTRERSLSRDRKEAW